MSAPVWARARSSPSRCRWGEQRWRTSPEHGQDETQESTSSGGTILVVEDDPAVRDLLQLLLDDEGHRTLVVADGRKALELAAQGAVPSLVIADYNLPNGLNGLEVIASLRKQLQHEIPAMVLTGDISTDTLREIAGHGCVHLNKPVRAKELTRHIQRLLAKTASAGGRARASGT